MFKVGDKFRCIVNYYEGFKEGGLYPVIRVLGSDFATLTGAHGDVDMYVNTDFELVQEAPTSRSTDPATSKGKRKVNKYEQAVLSFLSCNPDGTGKEIASGMREPLNCITPRFAPLRRKGLIKDSGTKRDKQIVWVLA